MELLVFLTICVGVYQTVAISMEAKTKMVPKVNTIQPSQKPEMYFTPANNQQQTEFLPVQMMPKPVFVSPQPQAMLIIAQPAYVPHNVLYGNQAPLQHHHQQQQQQQQQQQLLNFFHSNPQAKYQLLYGGFQPHPTVQPFITHNALGASTVAAYQVVPNPIFNGYNHLVAAPSQVAFNHVSPFQSNQISNQYVQPLHLSQISQIAQMAAQQFGSPIRSVPPIITGMENFTPEQQAQIKAQLGAHLGSPISTTPTITTSTNQYPQQLTTQSTQNMNSNEYAPEKHSGVQANNYNPLMYRAQFTKG